MSKEIENIRAAYQEVQEKLKGGQHKLDHDKDGDIDGKDFAMLRNKKKSKKKEDKKEGDIDMNPKLDKGSKDASEQKEAAQIDELSPGTLDSYTQKAQASKDALKKKARDHKAGGNDAAAKAAKDKAKKRDAGQTKAYARKLGKTTGYKGEPGSAMRKAADKMPKSYTKESKIRTALRSVLEKSEKNPNAKDAETMDDKLKGKGAKDMVNQPKEVDDTEAKGHDDASKAGRVTKPAKQRNAGDQVRSGDQKPVNAIAAAYKSMK